MSRPRPSGSLPRPSGSLPRPSPRARTVLAVALGLLLVCNPLYLDPLGVGAASYEYRAVAVEPTDEGLEFAARPPAEITRVRDLPCYPEEPIPVECALQAPLADGEPHTAVTADAYEGDGDSVVHLDGEFYRRSYRGERTEDGRTRMTVRYLPVSAETALAAASVDVDARREPYRRVVEDGRIATGEPLPHEPRLGPNTYEPTGRFLRADDGYYLLGLEQYDPGWRNRWRYSLAGVLVGAALLWHGGRNWGSDGGRSAEMRT